MDDVKSLNDSANKGAIPTAFQQKKWVKKLEAASGKPMKPRKSSGTVYLVMDCSGSMAEGSKIEQAKRGAIGFAKEAQRKEYTVGLIYFASNAEHILEPQDECTRLHATVERISAKGSTNMTEAVQMAKDKLFDKAGEKVICVVTDGMPDDKKTTLAVTTEARIQGIEIMAIGTDDADKVFLDEMVTRKDLSLKVSRDQLERGIISMAKMLPGKNG